MSTKLHLAKVELLKFASWLSIRPYVQLGRNDRTKAYRNSTRRLISERKRGDSGETNGEVVFRPKSPVSTVELALRIFILGAPGEEDMKIKPRTRVS